jgi:hypothetical protein
MAQDILEYCNGHNLTNVDMIGIPWEENCDAFATLYPEMVDKLIIADIAPKFYPQHHQSILGGLNAVDFSKKPSRSEVEEIFTIHIRFWNQTVFNEKLVLGRRGQLAFRFNVAVLIKKWRR